MHPAAGWREQLGADSTQDPDESVLMEKNDDFPIQNDEFMLTKC